MTTQHDLHNQSLEDLRARLSMAQQFGHFLTKAYNVLKSYGVDYQKLREYAEFDSVAEAAMRLKPAFMVEKLTEYFGRLNNALDAAVRRKSLKVLIDNTTE